jgi:predicted component of type VI protein secretion system
MEPHLDGEGVLVAVNCKICYAINGKPKLIVPKWDNLEKHMEKRRALVDLPKKGAKKGQC